MAIRSIYKEVRNKELQLRTHKALYKCIIWISLERWKATYLESFCPEGPKATTHLNFSSNMRNKKPKLQCLTETMDYQYLVSVTDTTTVPKFKRASVLQGSCHMTGDISYKISVWSLVGRSRIQTWLNRSGANRAGPCLHSPAMLEKDK